MLKLLVIGFGGFLGAIARYSISGWVHRYYSGSFPLGTLCVNVLGCLIMGGLVTLIEDRQLLAPNTRMFVLVGILGSLTTFSTFGHETVELLRDNNLRDTLINVAANVLLAFTAVWVGRVIARML